MELAAKCLKENNKIITTVCTPITRLHNNANTNMASLSELKRLAQTLLPKGSTLRSIILSEPDYLPRHEAAIKAGIFSKLLGEELANNR